jgi:DNA-binding response OmpR family regulator
MRILLATHNIELGLLRAKVLESAGHRVDVGTTEQQLLALMASRKYDALLVCHSLSEDSCETASAAFRSANPDGHVIGILKRDFDDDTCGTQQFDASVSAISGPSALLATVRHAGTQSAGSST